MSYQDNLYIDDLYIQDKLLNQIAIFSKKILNLINDKLEVDIRFTSDYFFYQVKCLVFVIII